MRRMPWPAYLWPGLPQIIRQGSWSALAVAVVAALALNTTLLGSFVWPDLIAPDLRRTCWVGIALGWGASAGLAAWGNRRRSRGGEAADGDPFSQALEQYLQGNWFEAERSLGDLLRRNQRDLEARLMLATILRHTKRFDDATRQLNILVKFMGSEKWELEIRREGELITEARRRTITDANTAQANSGEH